MHTALVGMNDLIASRQMQAYVCSASVNVALIALGWLAFEAHDVIPELRLLAILYIR